MKQTYEKNVIAQQNSSFFKNINQIDYVFKMISKRKAGIFLNIQVNYDQASDKKALFLELTCSGIDLLQALT